MLGRAADWLGGPAEFGFETMIGRSDFQVDRFLLQELSDLVVVLFLLFIYLW